jgi:hypothetical protein
MVTATGYFPWTVLASVYRPYQPLHAAKVPPVVAFTNERGEILRQMTLVRADGGAIDANGQVTGATSTLQYTVANENMAVSHRLLVSVLEDSQTVVHYYDIRDLALEIAHHRDDPPSARLPAGVSDKLGLSHDTRGSYPHFQIPLCCWRGSLTWPLAPGRKSCFVWCADQTCGSLSPNACAAGAPCHHGSNVLPEPVRGGGCVVCHLGCL